MTIRPKNRITQASLEAKAARLPETASGPVKPIRGGLEAKTEVCETCGLYKGCQSPVMAPRESQERPLLLIVGEAPGKEEDAQGKPFVGLSGKALTAILSDLGLDVGREVWLTNAVRCRPENNATPTDKQIKLCSQTYLHLEIARANPAAILALGNTALFSLQGVKNIGANRLKTFSFAPKEGGGPWKVLPTFHPAYLSRPEINFKGHETDLWLSDLEKALHFAVKGELPQPAPTDYRVVRTQDDLAAMLAEIKAADRLAWDIETTGLNPLDPRAAVVSLQFSTKTHAGWFVPLHHNSRALTGEIPWIESNRPTPLTRESVEALLREDAEKFGQVTVSLKECLKACQEILESREYPTLRGQNLKFDLGYVERVLGWKPRLPVFDCMIASYLLDEEGAKSGGHGLKNMAYKHTDLGGYEDEAGELHPGFIERCAEIPLNDFMRYGCPDVDIVLRVEDRLRPELAEQNLLEVLSLEMECLDFTKSMQSAGVSVDWNHLEVLKEQFPKELDRLASELRGYPEVKEAEVLHAAIKTESDAQKHGEGVKAPRKPVEFNAGSTEMRRTLLLERLGLPPYLLTDTGLPSTDRLSRQHWRSQAEKQSTTYEVLVRIDQWLKLSKLYTAYVLSLGKSRDLDDRVRASYNQVGTVTGRYSCSKPNMQQLPRVVDNLPGSVVGAGDIKALFKAPYPNWVLAELDFSQVEMRIAGIVSGDGFIRNCYANNVDMHRRAASQVFGIPYEKVGKDSEERQQSKSANFGALYLIGAKSLATNQGIPLELAERFLETVWLNFADYKKWIERTKAFVLKNGYVVSPLGHRRRPSGLKAKEGWKVEEALRQACNFPIQSAASKLTIYAGMFMSAIFRAEKMGAEVISQIHDSVVLAIPKDELEDTLTTALDVMENLPFAFLEGPNAIPLIAEAKIGPNLRDCVKWKRPVIA